MREQILDDLGVYASFQENARHRMTQVVDTDMRKPCLPQ